MNKPSHKDVQTLLSQLVLPFYEIERDILIPTQPEGARRNENDAEHSWSTAVLACSLAPHIDTSLDIGLISQFAIVHDMTEIYAGDTSVWASKEDLDSKEDNEAAALKKLKTKFSRFSWLVEMVELYEKQDTNEALYVRAIDKYIALCIRFMDGGKFYRKQGVTKERFEAGLVSNRKKAHGHSGVTEYYEAIRAEYDAHPEHFSKK